MQDKKSTTTPSPAYPSFDSLPNAAHVPMTIVCALLGCSPATGWRLVRSGKLPAPRKFGTRMTRFNVGDLRRSLEVSK
jgi:predicted DNA-binding transcriptional regulator AlpA